MISSVHFLLQSFFPGLIHIAYVIRPAGFLQKAISEVSNKFFKEEFKFKVKFFIVYTILGKALASILYKELLFLLSELILCVKLVYLGGCL